MSDPVPSIPASCDGCGACCMNESAPPYMPNELDVLPPALRSEVEKAQREPPVEKGCIWLDRKTLRCQHYEERPEVCRQFALAGEECLETRQRYFELTVLPRPSSEGNAA